MAWFRGRQQSPVPDSGQAIDRQAMRKEQAWALTMTEEDWANA